ncbi:MAG: VanZ family protein [Desulfobacterales bacterium]|nr:VanZ family protein [Desulfobacterales bacterium]
MRSVFRDIALPWLLLIGLCKLIFWQSSGPLPALTPPLPGFDKIAHVSVYALLAWLAARAFATLPLKPSAGWVPWAAAIFAVLYGLSDEAHQSFVPGRSADAWDLVADTIGAAIGALFYRRRTRARNGG